MFHANRPAIRLIRVAFCIAGTFVLACAEISFGGEWIDSRDMAPFVFRADYKLDAELATLRGVADLEAEINRTLELRPTEARIEVYLFHDRETYSRYVKKYFPQVPFRQAVYIKAAGIGRVFAYRSEQFAVDLRHECTHAILHAAYSRVPLWIDEGLAVYFEVGAERRFAKDPHFAATLWNARFGITPNLKELERINDRSVLSKNQYRDSWAWVNFLVNSPQMKRELLAYLSDLQTRPDAGPCLYDLLLAKSRNVDGQFRSFYSFVASRNFAKL